MTLPDERILTLLRERFVLGARNIERDGHVGSSHGYRCNQSAVGTTNGAGGRNVQLLVLACDGTVVHALPGFWHPPELAEELRLALELHALHHDDGRTPAQKQAMWSALHRAAARSEPTPRDRWQTFDEAAELWRASQEPRDSVLTIAGKPRLKSIRRLLHERLQAQPFAALADFDVAAFVDYGRDHYDNNQGLDDGRRFRRAERTVAQREKEREKERLAAEKAARKRS